MYVPQFLSMVDDLNIKPINQKMFAMILEHSKNQGAGSKYHRDTERSASRDPQLFTSAYLPVLLDQEKKNLSEISFSFEDYCEVITTSKLST